MPPMRRKGFTLLEMMLVIGLIGILSAGVIASLNPGEMLARNRNAKRAVDLNDILGAVTAYTIDQDGTLPPEVNLPAIAGTTTFSGAKIIGSGFTGARAVFVRDMDNDGDPDVLSARDNGAGEVSVWEQSGTAPDFVWTKRTVSSSFKGVDIEAALIDGDALPDIVAVDTTAGRVSWWKNQGGSPLTFAAPVTIGTGYWGLKTLNLADMDNDGDIDVVGARSSFIFDAVRWWRNNGSPGTPNWSYKKVEDSFFFYNIAEVMGVDIDEDGDKDVLGGGQLLRLYWWDNDGNPWQDDWDRYQVDSASSNVRGISYGDMDSDGDRDIVGISTSGEVNDWKNDGNPHQDNWQKQTVTTNMGGDSVAVADLDGDGDMDIAGASSGGDKLAWWENRGAVLGFSGTSVIETGAETNGIEEIALADIDGDTDTDIVAAMRQANTVSWWENLRISGLSEEAPTASIESELKPVCKEGVTAVECDANGGVSLNVLVPGFIAKIPIDPSFTADPVLTGYEIRLEAGTPTLHLAAPNAERGETIELRGSVGIENCLVWNVLNSYRECVLFE